MTENSEIRNQNEASKQKSIILTDSILNHIDSNMQSQTNTNSIHQPKEIQSIDSPQSKSEETKVNKIIDAKEEDNHSDGENKLLQVEEKTSTQHKHLKRASKSSPNRKGSKEKMKSTIQSPSKEFQQRKSAHKKMNEALFPQIKRKQSPLRSKRQQNPPKSPKNDSTNEENATLMNRKRLKNDSSNLEKTKLIKRKSSPMREMKPNEKADLPQIGSHPVNMTSKIPRQPKSPKKTFTNNDILRMFNSMTDNVFISHFTENK